jgi:hypothetical protein
MLDGAPFQRLYPSDLPPLPTAVTLEFFYMLDKFVLIALTGIHSDLPLFIAPVKLYQVNTRKQDQDKSYMRCSCRHSRGSCCNPELNQRPEEEI